MYRDHYDTLVDFPACPKLASTQSMRLASYLAALCLSLGVSLAVLV